MGICFGPVLTTLESAALARRRRFRADIARKATELETRKAPRAAPIIEILPAPHPKPEPAFPPLAPTWFRIVADLGPLRPSIAEIKLEVAQHFGVSVGELESERRGPLVLMKARQIACYLSRQLTAFSFPAIGLRFGNRDHSTIIHACAKVARNLPKDEDLAFSVAILFEKITGELQ